MVIISIRFDEPKSLILFLVLFVFRLSHLLSKSFRLCFGNEKITFPIFYLIVKLFIDDTRSVILLYVVFTSNGKSFEQ